MMQRIRDNKSLVPQNEGGRDRIDERLEERIIQYVRENPTASTRGIASFVVVSQSTVHRVIRSEGLYPYHYQPVHSLLAPDLPRRLEFCQLIQRELAANEDFLERILFTDESNFDRNGIRNFHNEHVWAEENPHAIREHHFQHRFSLNVWAGILGDEIIGPVILPRRLTGEAYLQFLQTEFPRLLDGVPLRNRRNMWWMHDGAPAHHSEIVRNYLTEQYGQRWIGREGPLAWPPRSPDLNPMDFFFWGMLKERIYATPVEDVDDLERRVMTYSAFAKIEM